MRRMKAPLLSLGVWCEANKWALLCMVVCKEKFNIT